MEKLKVYPNLFSIIKHSFTVALLFFTLLLNGQISTPELSGLKKFPRKQLIQKTLYIDNTGYFLHLTKDTVKSTKTCNYIRKLDMAFNPVFDIKLQPSSASLFNTVFYLKGNFAYIQARYDDELDICYDLSSIKFDGEIQNTKQIEKHGKPYRINRAVGIELSPDTSMFLFFNTYALKEFEKSRNLKIGVYGSDFQLVYEYKLDSLIKDYGSSIKSIKLTNDSSSLVLLEMKPLNRIKNTNSDKIKHTIYRLIILKGNTENPRIFDLKNEGKYFANFRLIYDNRNILHCTGFYSILESGPVTGMFDFEFTHENEPVKIFFNEFTLFDLKKVDIHNLTNIESKNGVRGIERDIVIKDVLTEASGRRIYIAEESSYYNWSMLMLWGGIPVNEMYSKSIFIFSFSGGGKLETIHAIPKWQKSKFSDDAFGYILFYKQGKVTCIYNESENNMEVPLEKWNAFDNFSIAGVTACVTISNEVSLLRKPLFENFTIKSPIIIPEYSKQINEHEYFVVFQDKFIPFIAHYYFARLKMK